MKYLIRHIDYYEIIVFNINNDSLHEKVNLIIDIEYKVITNLILNILNIDY